MSSEITETLLKLDEVLLYKIPPRKIAGGIRASEWAPDGDLSNPMFIGSGKVTSKGELAFIQIFKKSPTGEQQLFATCPIKINPDEEANDSKVDFFCEKVVDSSRYFSLRISDESGSKVAYIGIGFSTRDPAYDLMSVLNDHFRFVKRSRGLVVKPTVTVNATTGVTESIVEDTTPKLDLTFKEGQTVKINLKKGKKDGKSGSISTSKGIENEEWGDFEAPKASSSSTLDDDWGDFSSA